MKIPLIMYADMEPLLEKICTYQSNSEKSSTIKVSTRFLDVHYLRIVHLMSQKPNIIITIIIKKNTV